MAPRWSPIRRRGRCILGTDALVIGGLNAFYGDSHVLHDVSFTVKQGQVLGLLGRNGAGKTTCISAIVGLVRARTARLELFGQSIAGLSPEAISLSGIGLVPQGRRIFPSLTVVENLTVAARRSRAGHRSDWTLNDVYEAFPRLAERKQQLAGSLSGGEQQMLAISRALMTNPRLILFDEPSEGLAPQIVTEVATVLRRLRDSGLSIVLVEQNIKLALEIADDIVVLNTGYVAHTGGAEALRADGARIQQLLGVY
ncbi:ABC transporter ATP-binding protein [Bradyrhizobium zhanjiangense]|uniref:ABC transporter ATP-binding protein n=1 Tax=Bradyrhizobium zhanjiangense TaxID=1325107 RepID=A0A4Q0QSA3_9BRAD|nr:ABC transporter ATP-binding protein [Bradyrhizobium zhanjiangense]